MTENSAFVLGLAMFAFMMTVIWGAPLLRVLRHFRIGKLIRVDEPGHHNVKMGTPTMGGILFIIPVLLLTGLLNAANFIGFDAIGSSVLVPLIVLVGYAFLGALDDWEGIRGKRRGEGMRARTKFIAQVILALGTAYVLKYFLEVPEIILPGVEIDISLGIWYIPIAAFIIVSESNAINFTDWRHRPHAGTDLPRPFLFHHCWCIIWFSMVQRASSRTFHGRYRLACTGCDIGSCRLDDGSVAPVGDYCCYSAERGFKRSDTGWLFQADQGKTLLQNGTDPFAF